MKFSPTIKLFLAISITALFLFFLNLNSVNKESMPHKNVNNVKQTVEKETSPVLQEKLPLLQTPLPFPKDDDSNNPDIQEKELPPDPNLIIDMQQDPDPGEDVMQVQNLQNPIKEEEDQPLPPDAFKLLKEASLSMQKEAIINSFRALVSEDSESALTQLQISEGGNPIRNIIVGTWESGSAFLGEALVPYPCTFYHLDPLNHFTKTEIDSDTKIAEQAIKDLQAFLNCDYSQLQHVIEFYKKPENEKEFLKVFFPNKRLWKHCETKPMICLDPDFLSEMCKMFPYELMKVTKVRPAFLEPLLTDESMKIKILSVIRDPRDVMNSRKDKPWCKTPDCADPATLCADMVADFHTSEEFFEKYPDQFLVLRYEDILSEMDKGFEHLLHHFRLTFHDEIKKWLSKNGRQESERWITMYKKSANSMEELRNIEAICKEAMDLWGYISFPNTSVDSNTFNLVKDPPWKEMRIG